MKVGTVSFAVGPGRLVRRAGSVLFDTTGTNSDLVAGFDSAVSDDEAFEVAKEMLAASGLGLAPFAVVRWGETVDLLVFGDVAISTSTAIAPMISGASSTTWVEHHLSADYIQSEGSIGIWSGDESEAGTNLRLGVAACAGFRVDLVPMRSDGGVHEDEALFEHHDEPSSELVAESSAQPVVQAEPPTLDPTAAAPSDPIEDSRTDDLVGFAAVQAIANDVPPAALATPPGVLPDRDEADAAPVEIAEVQVDQAEIAPPKLVPEEIQPEMVEPVSRIDSDDDGDFFGSYEPRTRTGPEHTAVQVSPPLDDLWIDDPGVTPDEAASAALVPDEPIVDLAFDAGVDAGSHSDDEPLEIDDPIASSSSPLAPEFTESKMVAADDAAGTPATAATALCERGHSNPADSAMCFTCGGEMVPAAAGAPGQPVSGWLVFDDGTEVAVDRMLIIGRKPATFDEHSQAVVIDHPEVSRSHAQVDVQGWAVMLTDLGSRNGTWVSRPGAEPERLDAGEPRVLESGVTVLLGAPDASFTYRVDRA